MKRMNELFKLPINGHDLREAIIQTSYKEDTTIAHAINNVDALADALDALLASSIRMAGSSEFYQAQDDAQAALNAYRGAK